MKAWPMEACFERRSVQSTSMSAQTVDLSPQIIRVCRKHHIDDLSVQEIITRLECVTIAHQEFPESHVESVIAKPRESG